MLRHLALVGFSLVAAAPATALDLPARKPGLWELKMTFTGGKIPVQSIKQCIDAASDRLMNSNFGGDAMQQTCSKQDVSRSGATLTVDSICTVSGKTVTSHAVVTGSFDSRYTVEVDSTRGPDARASHMTLVATWLSPCEPGQRPGDMVMAGGIKINVLDLQKKLKQLKQLKQ